MATQIDWDEMAKEYRAKWRRHRIEAGLPPPDARDDTDRPQWGFKKDDLAHLKQELEGWKERCEELEIELECIRNAFPEHDHDVRPKRRGIY